MRKNEKRFVILWPIYFDKNKSWSEGRRVAKSIAVEKPSLRDLETAIKSLKYECVVEKNKKHPASWFEYQGRILVYTDEKKSTIIRKVAEKLISLRR